jgi:hypothetical protein
MLSFMGVALISTPALAFPGSATSKPNNSCASCHDSIRTDRMRVTPQVLMMDLGTQLDGQALGTLNAFAVEPGSTVVLSMDVLNGGGPWSAQLKQMEKGGQEISLANNLVWSQSGNAGWSSYGSSTPYLATSVRENTAAETLTVSFTVDAATPPDTYDLVFATAGKSSGLWYQEEHFYLEVAAPADPTWAGYPIDENGDVDTGTWLGWMNASKVDPWVFLYDLNQYIYLPESYVTEQGGWLYVPK